MTKRIFLGPSRTKYALVDADDYEELCQYSWSLHVHGGYAKRWKDGKTILMHRQIMRGKPNDHIDHANGNGLDNRKRNLRFCNRSENICNRKLNKNSTTGLKGVYRRKNKWAVTIQKAKVQIHVGFYNTKHDAAIAYDAAAVALHKHFAKTNAEMRK